MTELDRFASVVRAPRPSLAEGCSSIAMHLGHPMPAAEVHRRLDQVAAEVTAALGEGASSDLDAIARALADVASFRGDRTTYGAARNSLLPEVLVRRQGIPITLSIVLIEVAERCGTTAVGVGMPGHFLVGDGPMPRRWFDPFDGGIELDQAAAKARFHVIHGAGATFDEGFLAPTPRPQIFARVLNNLANAVRAEGDPTALVRVLELRDAIPAVRESPRSRVELAEALAAVGRSADAATVLERLLDRLDPRRRAGVLERIAQLRATQN